MVVLWECVCSLLFYSFLFFFSFLAQGPVNGGDGDGDGDGGEGRGGGGCCSALEPNQTPSIPYLIPNSFILLFFLIINLSLFPSMNHIPCFRTGDFSKLEVRRLIPVRGAGGKENALHGLAAYLLSKNFLSFPGMDRGWLGHASIMEELRSGGCVWASAHSQSLRLRWMAHSNLTRTQPSMRKLLRIPKKEKRKKKTRGHIFQTSAATVGEAPCPRESGFLASKLICDWHCVTVKKEWDMPISISGLPERLLSMMRSP